MNLKLSSLLFAGVTVFTPFLIAATGKQTEAIFTNIFANNLWKDKESVSGTGSNLKATATLRQKLPQVLETFSIKSILDIPCGDFNWMKVINLGERYYIGADIVEALIEKNKHLYENAQRKFVKLNAIESQLPRVDLILCRDMLVHLTFEEIKRVLSNFKKSGSNYLLVTTHTKQERNNDIVTGSWRKINFEKAPFNFPRPLLLLNEQSPEVKEFDKHLALWKLDDIILA